MLRLEFPFTAQQVVFMGRTPYCHGLFESPDDEAAVTRAMALTDSLPFAHREYRALSGGEKQRVVLASALAQDPSVLLLDEPTTFLDLKHQVATYSLLQSLAAKGMAVIAVTHDLNLAASYADRMVVLAKGCIAADGKPADVLQAKLLREVFEVDLEVREGPAGKPWVFYEQAAPLSGSPNPGQNAPTC
jgi:iron complex transport system ATP-binding protein